mmetsp:Transcript_11515/g.24289  ORF Transcript_11515/g.24289 Transcript_11515/m.24289 type:complete len:88 (-) Transcript_11515:293-556(-)
MNENNDLMERMMTRKAEARQQMEKKEGEVRFLQNELDRMRAERGEQDFENLRRASVDNGKDNNSNNNNRHGENNDADSTSRLETELQ